MQKSSVFSILLGLVLSFSSYADISRSEFIDQLDSANCSQVPPEIYLDTSTQHYDFANALSLSWISSAALNHKIISSEDLEQQWHITNLETIENPDNNLKIMIADYQDTVLVAFHYDDNQRNWENNEIAITHSHFGLEEATHVDFTQTLQETWETLQSYLSTRIDINKKLWIFGEGVGGAFAQLSAVGLENEGLYVDKVYLSNSPTVGSKGWIAKANELLDSRVHSLSYEQITNQATNNHWNPVSYIQDLSGVISGNMEQYHIQSEDGYLCALINILENE